VRDTRSTTESSTPLPRKLGLAPGMTVAFLDAPAHLGDLLGDLDAITVRRRLGGHPDVVLCFVRERAALTRRAAALRRAAHPDGGAYVPTGHAVGPWDPGQLHGGAPGALVASCLEEPGFAVVRITLDFLGPVTAEPLRVEARTVKPGRRAQLAEAELTAGDR